MVILNALGALATPTVSLEGHCAGRVNGVLEECASTARIVALTPAENGTARSEDPHWTAEAP